MTSVRVAFAGLLFTGVLSVAAPVPSACAGEPARATLVVDTEQAGGQFRYCVALPDGSVSGIELIQLAHEQHGLDYRLGYGGNAVCVLAGVGYESDECLKEGPEFWGYWRGDGSGGWQWSGSGANSTTVSNGDVEGWSWGTGNDGWSHPQPPRTTFASVCPVANDERSEGDASDAAERSSAGHSKRSAGTRASPATVAQEEAEASEGRRGDKKRSGPPRRHRADRPPAREPAPSLSPSPSVAPSVADRDSGDDGAPVGEVVATAAIAACLVGGIALQRRRKVVE